MEHARERTQQSGLAEAGHAFEQNVSAGQKANQHPVDGVLLAYDDFSNLLTNFVDPGNRDIKSGIRWHLIIVASSVVGGPERRVSL